jgi:hypothetical protein
MCDYSLHLVRSRPAKVGDKLVSTNFTNFLTRGFGAVGVAVCGCAEGQHATVLQLPVAPRKVSGVEAQEHSAVA